MFKGFFGKIWFLGILCSAFAIFLALLGMMYYYLQIEKDDILRQNNLLAQVMTHEIESGYIKGIWPYKTLKMVSDEEEVVFLWIAQPDGKVFWTDDPGIMGKIVQDPFLGITEMQSRDSLYDGQRIKLIAHPLKIELSEKPWTLFLGVSFKQLAKAQMEIMAFSVIFFAIAISFSAFISLYLSGSFTRPLRKLMVGVEAIGQGDLDYHIDVNTKDEISDLAAAFNQTAKKLKETRERDKQISQMKSDFISLAAHQLRTPLSMIKWGLSLIRENVLNEEEKSTVYQKVDASNERMISLVNDLLNVTRIEEGKFDYKFSAGQLTETLQMAVDELRNEADRRKVKLIFNIPSCQLPKIQIDKDKMRIALTNIIENAIKYSLPGGQVEISLICHKSDILITIRDQGVGIPKAEEKRVFEKFFRGSNAVRLETEGSGLGLFMAKNIIEHHGGQISFKSKQNQSTTFFIILSLERQVK
ncbi:MAG: hypothetical protein A2445_03685 [Candidatus Jacksonbacteria bacterium RIFOXYC2_FULL_44_29]|nr:MAG: hypothetical protein A2295_02500 [Candidatus Jacksonbacteria bacterium RIFOXYB2_FULL_44_15]OGY75857.1 MAG: hypothetical protein A2240_01580 [Candidatus Jacksonbacteria bacterium RIFOXYA2_FULL_43_12]OGY77204.1 MAG: hypothetical protein A2445_03685 [Candidatus Jacksonbacteria bacterium RIFOXYC2_FULL_44_29]OGY79780.1 MAG: hypothetical protein A2550_01930 [Candidatus Jacksonbacteria bacterium RIFOXYD2_FULL_43_21]HBH46564.1 hypothetical protein [Candidatus Jacksonbacteria bacterium]